MSPVITSMLIKAGSGIDDHDKESKTPVQVAVLNSSMRALEPLLDQGADANLSSRYDGSTPEDGKTALFYAIDPKYCKGPRRSTAIVRLLVQHGADVNKMDGGSLPALHLAARNGSVSLAQLLLDHGAKINPQITSSMLLLAVKEHRKQMVAWLLARGANVNHRGQDNETSIYGAIRASQATDDTSIVRRLLDAGANINCEDAVGLTPLHLAIDLGWTEIIKMLIERGADIHARDDRGQTPLHKAVRLEWRDINGTFAVTKLLLEHGADLNAMDRHGYTPVHIAACGNRLPVSQKLLEVLLRAGGNVHALSHSGNSPMDMFISRGGDKDVASNFFKAYGA